MKVVLINPPQFTKYPQPPIGLALIAAVLERENYQVTVLDANALKLQPEYVAPHVSNADVIGLTAMTPTINSAIAIARHLKKTYPDLPIILGGAPVFESSLLNKDDIQYWTRRAYREFYLRPSHLWQQIRQTTSIRDLKVNIKGLLMLLGNIRPM